MSPSDTSCHYACNGEVPSCQQRQLQRCSQSSMSQWYLAKRRIRAKGSTRRSRMVSARSSGRRCSQAPGMSGVSHPRNPSEAAAMPYVWAPRAAPETVLRRGYSCLAASLTIAVRAGLRWMPRLGKRDVMRKDQACACVRLTWVSCQGGGRARQRQNAGAGGEGRRPHGFARRASLADYGFDIYEQGACASHHGAASMDASCACAVHANVIHMHPYIGACDCIYGTASSLWGPSTRSFIHKGCGGSRAG